MSSKRILALLVGLFFAVSLLAACGTNNTASTAVPTTETASQPEAQTAQSTTAETDKTEPKDVIISLGCWGSSPAETKLLDDQIQVFQNENPNITIKKLVQQGDYLQSIQTKIASKTEPDVYYLDVNLASNFMSKNILEALDAYIDKEDVKDFETNLLSAFQKDGVTYGLPKDYNTLVLFYNQDMFDKVKLKAPATWNELQEAAKKLTTDKVKGIVLPNDAARFGAFILQAGGKINNGNDPAFNTPEAAKGLDFYYSFFKNKYAATPKDLGDGWPGDSLARGKAAMVIEGGWMIPFMKDAAPNVKYGIAKLPKGELDGDLAFTVAYVMSKNSKNKDAAAKVISFLTGKAALQIVADSGLAIPSRKSMGGVYTQTYPERKPLVDMVPYSQVFDFGLNGSKIMDALNKAGEKLQLGQLTDAKAALADAESALK